MRRGFRILALTAVVTVALTAAALSAAPTQIVAMKLGSPVCIIGDTVTQIDESSADVKAVAEGGRTLVPIRRILEAFGGAVAWVPEMQAVQCSLNGVQVELVLNSAAAQVNGGLVTLDVPAQAVNGRTLVPVRFVSEQLGLQVGYEAENQIVVVADGALESDQLLELSQVQRLITATKPKGEPIQYTQQSYSLSSGRVTANVIAVNPADPSVRVQAAIPGGLLNNPQGFSSICQSAGATAIINANFFRSEESVKDPIGHLMINGQFQYASSGISSLGITASGEMRYGRPAVFVRVKTSDEGALQEWSAFEVNVLTQFSNQSVLYTPARGASFPVSYPGAVLIAENGVSTAYRAVSAGDTVEIPANGFVLYSSTEVTATDYYRTPELGRPLTVEPYLFKEDEEGFSLDGVQTIISGSPRLVRDGAIETRLDAGFDGVRFKGSYAAPRTAVGTTAEGSLLLVSVPSATIQQMRELMLELGCIDAFNLDGGGSTGMYYNGNTLASPGRSLVSTFQVFVS